MGQCTNVAAAASQLQQIRNSRQAELTQADGLSTGALPNPGTLRTDLIESLTYSLAADNDYLTWAQQSESSCTPGSQPGSALAADGNAVNFKDMFVAVWNPIAASYGLPSRSAGQI